MKTAVTPTREEDFSAWYLEVIRLADLAEHAPVRGCMIIKPNAYAIWENIQNEMNKRFRQKGVRNAYFPLFIPLSFFEKEAAHVEGFATETAVVTHTRLTKTSDGKLIPDSPLEEPLVVRPTSEMIIGASFAQWIKSYRDLPLKINQWANVVRWEMRPRLFLRTAEFLWQEGHTAHATGEEANQMAREMLELYGNFAEEMLAIPSIRGEKSEGERFPGAENTYTFEAMMQDGKALQMGTSHYMGTNFAKASEIKFLDAEGNLTYAHTTSWGSTTRMIGAIIMTHGDDNGLRLPPRIASEQVAIIPFAVKDEDREITVEYCRRLQKEISDHSYFGSSIRAFVDERSERAGEKSWDAVKKGYPIRIEIGPRDIENDKVLLFLRTKDKKEKIEVSRGEVCRRIPALLDQIHHELYQEALSFRDSHIISVESLKQFNEVFRESDQKNLFVRAPFYGDRAVEEKIKKEHGVTVRCIPFNQEKPNASCLFTNKREAKEAIFAKSY